MNYGNKRMNWQAQLRSIDRLLIAVISMVYALWDGCASRPEISTVQVALDGSD
ncbi:hypothetical protein [Amycolatopsis sp. NPDC051061]|uniref:hypothetical protein n=1 Tax=Amycolatopsis sp. NPDC051061 TaxID=3155042 RepID=UPI00342BA34F